MHSDTDCVYVFSGAGDMFIIALSEGTKPQWSRGL